MPTPATGAISMSNIRDQVFRTSTGSLSMTSVRNRYGGSGAISVGDLRASEGFTITCGSNSQSIKGTTTLTSGWTEGFAPCGSVSPNEANGTVQYAANSFVNGVYTTENIGALPSAETNIVFVDTNTTSPAIAEGTHTSGWAGTDITRVVVANTSRSIDASFASSVEFGGAALPSSGTLLCLVKF